MNPRVLYRAATYATDARAAADSVISALTPAAWYRNATGVTESGGFASQWDDYSGNARHLVQGVGTKQPAYANGILTFDGVDNYMKASAFTLNQPVSIYIVYNQVSWTAVDHIFDGNTDDVAYFAQRSGGSAPEVSVAAPTVLNGGNGPAVGSYGISCVVFNGASSSHRLNNNAKASGNANVGNPAGFTLASIASGTFRHSNIGVKEIVIFGAAHNDATQDSVITALNNALTVF